MTDRLSFNSSAAVGSEFLALLRNRISVEEVQALRGEPEWGPPNELDFDSIVAPLHNAEFPSAGFYEIEWAIYECGWDSLRLYSAPLRIYLACLYVYCNKRRQWSIVVDSDYFYLAIEAVMGLEQPVSSQQFAGFVEWMSDHVTPDAGYENYYELLSWALMQRVAPTANADTLRAVLGVLLAKDYDPGRLAESTVSDRGVAAWLALHHRVPSAGAAIDEQFERIILGGR